MLSPRPLPLPTSLVVKNGSKTRSRTSGSMPSPSSGAATKCISALPGVVDSTGLLNLERLPASLVIIGGGVIGCEFACFFGSVGVPVTVIEMLPEICPQVDADLAKMLRAELGKKNITFHTGAKVLEITKDAVRFSKDGQEASVPRDVVLVSTGRVPNVQDLGLEDARVEFDKRGIKAGFRLTQARLFAAGAARAR